jgi:hypothetical protein
LGPARHRIGHEREHVVDQDLRIQHNTDRQNTAICSSLVSSLCACVRACVRVCVRVCVCACVRVCVCV